MWRTGRKALVDGLGRRLRRLKCLVDGARRRRFLIEQHFSRACLIVVLVAGCSGGGDPESTIPAGAGADTAAGAVEELVSAINAGDFAGASHVAVPGQAALASLAEGASFAEVAESLRGGDQEIAANFWAGFAQGAGSFLMGDVTPSEEGTLSQSELEFHTITVQLPDDDTRTLIVRDADGFRVDIFASFAPGLADKMIAPAERLLTTQTEEARLVLAELQKIVPSLLVAASLPGTTPETSQQIFALIEVITRVG